MALRKSITRVLVWLLLIGLPATIGSTSAGPSDAAVVRSAERGDPVQTGARLERSGRWVEAIEHYERALKQWPDNEHLRYGLRRSKVHFGIDRRYSDRSFETALLPMSRAAALDRFDEVLYQVKTNFVDPVSITSFVAHGTESLYLALANDKFSSMHLGRVNADRVGRLRTILRDQYWNKAIAHRLAARETVGEICDLAAATIGLPAGAVVMEYIFGGCYSLDEYSAFLTPDRLSDLYGNIDGEFVGLGIEMKAEPGRGLALVNVLPDSPAAAGGLKRGDFIVAIEGADSREMTTDEGAKLLRGPSGSSVRLRFQRGESGPLYDGTFFRRSVHVKSVPVAKIVDRENGVAYVQMTGFQRTTPQELDEALLALQRQGMRALIWDLRGNPGGLLPIAAEVTDRFIGDGLLVSTRGRQTSQNDTWTARRAGTWTVPLVLLVDRDSASASEIVAGAIRDHRRGTIVGRTTYGKWTVQTILPLSDRKLGLRLTTAKFYSPSGQCLSHVGVAPDVVVDLSGERQTGYRGVTGLEAGDDADVDRGLEVLRRQLRVGLN
ncbi:MAG TPA: S41 family peptidase [Planctomycetaceae bacterium]|nr:S41 family peptidase [Planctomycetaceae bacterium]